MNILDGFTGDVGRALALLSADERARLKKGARVKNDRLYLRCYGRDKEVRATPKEVVRQLWLDRLVNRYDYPLNRIRVEEPIVIGRDATGRADIVITDRDRPDTLYAIFEIKQVKARDVKEQLRS